MITMFILAIVCAVNEASLKNGMNMNTVYINVGAFGSASFFGFLLTILYGVKYFYFHLLNSWFVRVCKIK